jgi:hypothetical protein
VPQQPRFRSFSHSQPSWRRAALIQPATFTIPSFPQSTRRPANIPLHNLSSSSRPRDHDSAYLLDDHDKDSARSSFDTPSSDSDLSLWSDTGDLVDQLADREDPLRIQLAAGNSSKPPRQQKRTRFASQDFHEKGTKVLRIEDIDIPDPGPRTISKAEQILAAIMAPNDGPSRIHGLHGKKLMWVGTTMSIATSC